MGILSIFEKLKKTTAQPQKSATSIPPRPAQPRPAQTEPFVYVTLKGKKFHYSRVCPGLRHSKEVKMTLSKARKAGYTACDKCEKYRYFDGYEII